MFPWELCGLLTSRLRGLLRGATCIFNSRCVFFLLLSRGCAVCLGGIADLLTGQLRGLLEEQQVSSLTPFPRPPAEDVHSFGIVVSTAQTECCGAVAIGAGTSQLAVFCSEQHVFWQAVFSGSADD